MSLKNSSKTSKAVRREGAEPAPAVHSPGAVGSAPAGVECKPTGLRDGLRLKQEDAYEACRASLARVLPEVGVFVNHGDGCYVPHGGTQLKRVSADSVEVVDLFRADGIFFLKEGAADISDFIEPDGSLNHYGKGVLSSVGYGPDGQTINNPDGSRETWKIDLDSVRIQDLTPELQDQIVGDLFAGMPSYTSDWVSRERAFGGEQDVARWAELHPLNGAGRLEDVTVVLKKESASRADVTGFRGEHTFESWTEARLEETLAGMGLGQCGHLPVESVEGWLVQSAYEKRWAEKIALLHSTLPKLGVTPLAGAMALDPAEGAEIGLALVALAEQAAREGWVFDSEDLGGQAVESVREACPWVGLRPENKVNLTPDRWDWIGQVVAPSVSAAMEFREAELHDGPLGGLDAAPVKAAPVFWGARAIYRVGKPFDLVVDRQTASLRHDASPAQRDALIDWLKSSGLGRLQQAVLEARLDPAGNEAVEVEAWPFRVQASPKGSHGYLYIQAFMQDTLGGRDIHEGRWTGFGPVPEVGQVVEIPGNEVGPSTVLGYRIVDGGDAEYLGLVVRPRSDPRWLRIQREEDGVSGVLVVYGPEVRRPTWP